MKCNIETLPDRDHFASWFSDNQHHCTQLSPHKDLHSEVRTRTFKSALDRLRSFQSKLHKNSKSRVQRKLTSSNYVISAFTVAVLNKQDNEDPVPIFGKQPPIIQDPIALEKSYFVRKLKFPISARNDRGCSSRKGYQQPEKTQNLQICKTRVPVTRQSNSLPLRRPSALSEPSIGKYQRQEIHTAQTPVRPKQSRLTTRNTQTRHTYRKNSKSTKVVEKNKDQGMQLKPWEDFVQQK